MLGEFDEVFLLTADGAPEPVKLRIRLCVVCVCARVCVRMCIYVCCACVYVCVVLCVCMSMHGYIHAYIHDTYVFCICVCKLSQ